MGTKVQIDLSEAVERKLLSGRMHFSSRLFVRERCERFVQELQQVEFGALVTDFDGTILPIRERNGPIPAEITETLLRLLRAHIPIFFATGRGESIVTLLRRAFPETLWPSVYIAYFNGAYCQPLSESPGNGPPCIENCVLKALEDSLRADPICGPKMRIKNKNWQITLVPEEWNHVNATIAQLQKHLARFADRSLRLVTSSHSIDILPMHVSKANCISLAQTKLLPPLQVLAIGDCGSYPGNDFELLQHPFSLSVDAVSGHLDSCWNLLPRGTSHSQGAEFYLNHLNISSGRFTLAL
jgi:trehalose-6-phosphatase